MQQQFAGPADAHRQHPGLEALEDGFFMVDAAWRLTYWNAAAEELLNVPRERVLGRELWSAVPFLDETTSRDALRTAMMDRQANRYIDLFPGGAPGSVSVYAAPLDDGGIGVHFRDATEEVKYAEQYSALLESIRSGCVAVDDEWTVMYMNGAAESLLGLSKDRAQERSIWRYLPRQPPEIGESLRATMVDGIKRRLHAVQIPGRLFRGRIYDICTYPLAGGGISILFEDVSERAKREAELARLAAEAQEANRAKSRFFAAASHELRTPLNAIVGYNHLIASGMYGELPDPVLRAADRAGICAEHLARLVDDLLLLTASELGRVPAIRTAVSIESFLDSATAPYKQQAEAKGLEFLLDVPDPGLPVETDPERLRQLLAALLTNAVKYTSRGRISVGVSMLQAELELTVSDTGCGIDAADQERIFAVFEQGEDPARSDPLVRGSGLGLTVARRLATLLGGSLRLVASSPSGSCFSVRLPLRT
ncbi:MAG: ATP-binding protein [Gemmatimonadota bacterium]